MRAIENRQNDIGTILKIIVVVVLASGVLFVLVALGVGFVAWQLLDQPKPVSRPAPVPMAQPAPPAQPRMVPPVPPNQPPAPKNQPPLRTPKRREPQPRPQDGSLKSLPSPRPFVMDLSPPPKPDKRLEFTIARTFIGHSGMVVAVALSPDEHRVLSCGWDNTVRLWDLDSGKELANLKGHTNPARGVAFSPDGKRAVSASLDGTLKLWDLDKISVIRTFNGHKGSALCVAFSPDGERLLSGGNDRALRLWDVATGKQLQELYGHDGDINSVSVSSDGATALIGSSDGGATHWDLGSGRQLAFLSVGSPVSFALFAADGKHAIVGGDAPARLCDLSTGEQCPELPPADSQPVRAAALLPGDNLFLQAAGKRLQGRFLRMRHVHPGTLRDPNWNLLGEVEAHNGPIASLCASRNGQLALTGGEDGAVKLWRITEREGAQ